MRTETGSTWRARLRAIILLIPAFMMLAMATSAEANPKYAGIVIDAKTGKVLYANSADSYRYPASLTKMMTIYMMLEAIDAGQMSKKTRIRMTAHGASMQPSKLGMKVGQTLSAEQAILALVTKSANDVAAAVGDHMGGSEAEFAKMMTQRARQLGMSKTTFRNASGLPDSKQVTTARDMAMLGIALREHFPHHYHYFETRSFTHGKNTYSNHNRLLGSVRGVDGIKTGYTRASGYNLVSSVETNGRSIVAVVMGGKSGKSRNAQMVKLIDTYLPRASRGRDRMLVAKAPSQGLFASLFSRVKQPPVPTPSPATLEVARTAEDRVLVAHTAALGYSSPVEISQSEIRAVKEELGDLSGSSLPVPQPSPTAAADPIVTAAVRPTEKVEGSAPAAAGQGDLSGWHIQIGAMPSRENALRQLERARSAEPALLSTVVNHTETVEKNGTTLYRARFAGFASKDAAWDACARLKKRDFACLALAN